MCKLSKDERFLSKRSVSLPLIAIAREGITHVHHTVMLISQSGHMHKIPYMDRDILFCTVFVLAGQPIGRL